MTARRQRVLVVDDEGSITGALALILGEGGYEVRTAGSVAEGHALLLEGAPFDLVFTDLRLPDATGIELLERIKADAPDTQVILMTAHGSLDLFEHDVAAIDGRSHLIVFGFRPT